MKIKNFNKKKFILKMIENFSKKENFDSMVLATLNELKIDKDKKDIIQSSLFPNGLMSLMMEMNDIINELTHKKKKPRNFKKFKINEKIKYFILTRLQIIQNLVDKKKIFFLMIKLSSFKSMNNILFNVADEIWFLSGDKSTDMNYYSKRMILMKIYAATFCFFVFDNSDDFFNTKKFLEKQISTVLIFGKFKGKIKTFFNPQ